MNKVINILFVFISSVLMLVTTAKAELIDNSTTYIFAPTNITTNEQKIDYSRYPTANAKWDIKPIFNARNLYRLTAHLPACDCDAQGQPLANCQEQKISTVVNTLVNEQGILKEIKISKSSGVNEFDRIVIRSLRKAKLLPFIRDGQPVIGKIEIPFDFSYSPNLKSDCKNIK